MRLLLLANRQQTSEFNARLAPQMPLRELEEAGDLDVTNTTALAERCRGFDALISLGEGLVHPSVAPSTGFVVISGCPLLHPQPWVEATRSGTAPAYARMNTWPGFINKPLWEMALPFAAHQEAVEQLLTAMGIEARFVENRAGFVAPRVIAQIINEACYTVQEGTATEADIDLAMQLGVNYPQGPFAWAAHIGWQNVERLLNELWEENHDPRYKTAAYLRKKALQARLQTL